METNIKIFTNPDFGQIRTTRDENGEPLFCLTDLCKVLELRAPDVKRRLDDAVVSTHTVKDSLGRKNLLSFVNEDGFYDTVLDSRKPEAKAFRKWVTSEVLPQIRQTGGYIPVKEEDDEKTILCKALLIYKRTIEEKDAILEQQKPKVMFADAVTSQEDSILISEMAKLLTQNGYEIGRTRFFRWLRENGYLFKHSTEPIQKWVERGIFDTHVTIINTNHGQRESITTKVTGKGQKYFINLFIRNNI